MNHEEFDWDFENITHIARHGVTPEEAEEVFLGPNAEIDVYFVDEEERYDLVGPTRQGRILLIAVTERLKRTRIVTAFRPNARLIRNYLRQVARDE